MANKVTEVFEKASHKAQRVAASAIVDRVLSKLYKDRTKAYLDIVDLVENFWKGDYPHEVFDKVREAIKDPDNRWIKYINSIIDETDKNVAKVTLLNMGFEAFIRGTKMIRKNREVYKCNIPWLILFDPTTACNMHCEGCWSGTYGHKFNLSFEDMDKIITQGKELGVYLYLLTGGEPTVRKKDIIRLAEKHNDVEIAMFTNSTLIDEAFCKECVRLGNLTFLLSIEGTPDTNDARRGEGHYEAVMKAMDLLKKLRDQEQKATDTVYEFFREQMKKDSLPMKLAKKHYDGYLKNDPEYSSFEDWFKDCVYDMSGSCWKEGVEYSLGELKYNDKFEQYLEDVKFNDFLKDKDYHCQVKFIYSDGSSILVDPSVLIKVEFLERPLSYGK